MKYFILIIALAAAVGGYWYFTGGEQSPGQPGGVAGGSRNEALVEAAPVRRELVIDTIEALGTAQANESVTLTAKVTDVVSSVSFEDGAYVEKGTILLVQANDEQTALLAEARANLDEAASQLRRVRDLYDKRLVPDSELDTARAQADAAKARFDSITARLDDRLVRAPYSGILGFRQVSPGTLLTNNTPITTLDDISIIKLDFSIPETHINDIQPGFRIIAHSDAFPEREFSGEIRTIGSRVDPVTRAVLVRAIVPNAERLLRPGMLLTVKIVTDERMGLVISENALIQTGEETYVFMAGTDGLAHKRPVITGARRYDNVEVIEGLEEGEMIITEGAFKLRDGVPYRMQGQAPAARERVESGTEGSGPALAHG
jgi:membrane fusion protein (multidrug efflux system)